MRHPVLVLTILTMAAAATPAAHADADGHVNFFLGQKSLDSGDWAPVDDQGALGAVMSFGMDDWPVHIAVDVLGSWDEEDVVDPLLGSVTLTASTFEIDAGVRKIWKVGRNKNCMPYVGAGAGILGAAAEVDAGFATVDADDAALGFWAGGGVFWRLGTRFNIGLDVRYSAADVNLDFGGGMSTGDVAAGGLSYGLLLGFGW